MDPSIFEDWEAVIGLEIHVVLKTVTKLFSPAPNQFGDEPNTNITDVCTGQPGTLPVLNKAAVEKAVRFGCAVSGHIENMSYFDRKSYFYPDSPRNFQITQFDCPIILGGTVIADVDGEPVTFKIRQVHLEDDAGMLKHFSTFAGVDYNRAGNPLIEIVSEPCMKNAKEAIAYATGVKAILQYIDASDCNMEQGTFRMDANISVRPKGTTELRNKVEIKNLNSFTFLGLSIDAEFKRQVKAYIENPALPPGSVIQQSTYRWDPEKKDTIWMRGKESAEDYRYFLEPDLPPLVLAPEYVHAIRTHLPELPYERSKRYRREYELSQDAANQLVNEKALADYYEAGLKICKNPKSLCNWILVEFPGRLKEQGKTLWNSGIDPINVAMLVNLIDEGKITGKIAKKVADVMVANPKIYVEEIVESNPEFQPVHDENALETIIDEVLAQNEQSVIDYRSGKTKAFAFLVGQVMKATQGQASPAVVNRILLDKINK